MYLNTHSCFSLRYGIATSQDLISIAQENGFSSVVLTDINNTSACLDFIRQAKETMIQPIVGVDFRNSAEQMYVAIAKNNQGYQEINHHLSEHLSSNRKLSPIAPIFQNVYVIYPFDKDSTRSLHEHEFWGISIRDLNRYRFASESIRSKAVLFHTATFRSKTDYNTHRLLRAIDNNTLLSKLPPNQVASPDNLFLSPDTLLNQYQEFPELLQQTQLILDSCSIDFEFGTDQAPKNQRCYTSSEEEDFELLQQLCEQGLSYRYPQPSEAILERIQKELQVIQQKEFVSYFLINWDIVHYARDHNFFYVGRGSGANSIIAYLLKITDVDPIDLDLYFERFINLHRKNPPDFDIDFSWKDRDQVIEYIFKRFPNTSLLATYNSFQKKSVIRELGKVFGLPKHEIDLLSEGKSDSSQLDRTSHTILKYSSRIQGLPNHLSIHAGGIIISEGPAQCFAATFMPPKGFPTLQIDMVIAEDVGLYKFDILSQRGLAKIKEALSIIAYNRPEAPPIDIHDINRFKQDEQVKYILRNAMAIGCFYVESPAMRMLLKKLRVDSYLGLVAASSIIRPGVAKSGMMREYILRFRHPEKRKEAPPALLEIMPETYGIMVYQEDVIKVAHYFAGLSLGEADMLRRGMSGKFRSRDEFSQVQNTFFKNCKEKKYSDELVANIWRQIESFAGYAFAKGHSASYAVESYQSLFLKAHYPLEYMVATINNFGGFYRTELYIHEAKMHGATIHLPCINQSNYKTTIQGKNIFLGFMHLNALEHTIVDLLLLERDRSGLFIDFEDFTNRVSISVDQVSILIRIGAFRFTNLPKRNILWKAHLQLSNQKKPTINRHLFCQPQKQYNVEELPTSPLEDAFDQIEILGFSLQSPFQLVKEKYKGCIPVTDFPQCIGKTIYCLGHLITLKNTATANGKKMHFGTFVDQTGHFIDTVHFPLVAKEFPFSGKGIYLLKGMVVEEFDSISIEVQKMCKLTTIEDPRYVESHQQIAS